MKIKTTLFTLVLLVTSQSFAADEPYIHYIVTLFQSKNLDYAGSQLGFDLSDTNATVYFRKDGIRAWERLAQGELEYIPYLNSPLIQHSGDVATSKNDFKQLLKYAHDNNIPLKPITSPQFILGVGDDTVVVDFTPAKTISHDYEFIASTFPVDHHQVKQIKTQTFIAEWPSPSTPSTYIVATFETEGGKGMTFVGADSSYLGPWGVRQLDGEVGSTFLPNLTTDLILEKGESRIKDPTKNVDVAVNLRDMKFHNYAPEDSDAGALRRLVNRCEHLLSN